MKKLVISTVIFAIATASFAQTISRKIANAYHEFTKDLQLKYAISSLYVVDAKTGNVVFDKNSTVGLAPGSSQKVITAVTAFELLGKDYKYKTSFFSFAKNQKFFLLIKPSGDPTLGSWRWPHTKEDKTIKRIIDAIKKAIISIAWPIHIQAKGWASESIPGGWIWEDIGNYYGSGAGLLNWRENQFDVFLESGAKLGDSVIITHTKPKPHNYTLSSLVTSAATGTGDHTIAYFPIAGNKGMLRGTIPINEKNFVISASFPDAKNEFENTLTDSLQKIFGKPDTLISAIDFYNSDIKVKLVHTEISPALDSIVFWLLKKSVNLYGEALIKTVAFEKTGFAVTDTGINIVKDFWEQKKIDSRELNLYDGSGLSPLNRVTTHAQVEVLKYAKRQNWFNHFYNALPEYNGMKLKSGTIADVKAFCGYHKARDGKEYVISFIVNNYSGPTTMLVNKMYHVLDVLK